MGFTFEFMDSINEQSSTPDLKSCPLCGTKAMLLGEAQDVGLNNLIV